MRDLIERKDFEGIRKALSSNPALANEPISLSDHDARKAHPLHRICDGVFAKKYTDDDASVMATIFFEFGANVNGSEMIDMIDTPLIAASSLNADHTAELYIDRGADLGHRGCHGGTALHWAAWCGREELVKKLIVAGADINKKCVEFDSTPLLWAVHGYKFGESNRHHQIECVKLLADAGAEKNIPNKEGKRPIDFLSDDNPDDKLLKELLR